MEDFKWPIIDVVGRAVEVNAAAPAIDENQQSSTDTY